MLQKLCVTQQNYDCELAGLMHVYESLNEAHHLLFWLTLVNRESGTAMNPLLDR